MFFLGRGFCLRSAFGEIVSGCDSSDQASDVGKTSTAGRSETFERRGYHFVQDSDLLVCGLSRLVIWGRLSDARDEKLYDIRR